MYRALYDDPDEVVAKDAIRSSPHLRLPGIAEAFDERLWSRYKDVLVEAMPDLLDSRSTGVAMRAQAMLQLYAGAKYDANDIDDLTRSPRVKLRLAGINVIRDDELQALALLQKALIASSSQSNTLIRKMLERQVNDGGGILCLDCEGYFEYANWLEWTGRFALRERRVSLLPVLESHKELLMERFMKRNEMATMKEVVEEDFLFGDPRAKDYDLALTVRLLWNIYSLGGSLSQEELELLHQCRYLGSPEEHLRRSGLIK